MTRKEVAAQIQERHRELVKAMAAEIKKAAEKEEKGNGGK